MGTKKLSNKSKDIILICVVVLLVIILVVLITVGIKQKQTKETTTTKQNITHSVTSPAEDDSALFKVKKQGSKYVLDDDKENLPYDTGLYKCVIPKYSKEPRWYEFQNGKLDTSFTGLQDSDLQDSQGRDRWFYVQNGVVDPNFEGLVSIYPYMRVVQHGEWNQDANGQLYWEDQGSDVKYRVTDGVLYGTEMAHETGYVIPQDSKVDGGHYYIVNK